MVEFIQVALGAIVIYAVLGVPLLEGRRAARVAAFNRRRKTPREQAVLRQRPVAGRFRETASRPSAMNWRT